MQTLLDKKTKIIGTIGPATQTEEKLSRLLKTGLNVVRMNFSHGDFAEHQQKVDNGRKASKKTGIPIAFLQDLGGPKIRTGYFQNSDDARVNLKKGQQFTLTTRKVTGNSEIVSVSYKKLPQEVMVDHKILVDDGKVSLRVVRKNKTDIICKVINGGELKGRRGINVPEADLSISSLTPKDKKDLEFGIKNKVDYIALSFVRRPSDIVELRNILEKRKSQAGIVAKIETPQAVEKIDEIIELADAIMVARGDLAIEMPKEEVPLIQKNIIRKCNKAGKPVITATQMLESMIKSPTPTRAEVSDIANAILDGTDAIMLSEETTLGDYPVEAVEVMAKVAKRVESDLLHEQLMIDDFGEYGHGNVGKATLTGAVYTADEVGSKFIICLTSSGYSARMISRYKPSQRVIALTPNEETLGKSLLYFGVTPIKLPMYTRLSDALKTIRKIFLNNGWAKKGDDVVIVTSQPFGKVGNANAMIVETL